MPRSIFNSSHPSNATQMLLTRLRLDCGRFIVCPKALHKVNSWMKWRSRTAPKSTKYENVSTFVGGNECKRWPPSWKSISVFIVVWFFGHVECFALFQSQFRSYGLNVCAVLVFKYACFVLSACVIYWKRNDKLEAAYCVWTCSAWKDVKWRYLKLFWVTFFTWLQQQRRQRQPQRRRSTS